MQGYLSSMVGEEEVVPQEDDGGKELPEAGLVPVAGQELCQPSILGTNKRSVGDNRLRTVNCQA